MKKLVWQKRSLLDLYQSIYFACLFVRLYAMNFKTAEPTGPKFCVELLMSPNFVSNKIQLSLNLNNPQIFFYKNPRKSLVYI